MIGRRSGIIDSAEEIILNTIILAGKNGIAKNDLLLKVSPLDQSTVYRITKKLEQKALIKIIRNGQRTRYFALNSSRMNVGLGAYLLGKHFTLSILGKKRIVFSDFIQDDFVIKSSEKDGKIKQALNTFDFSSYRNFLEPKFTENSLEEIISEFSNQIGAFITYVLIQAMNEDNINKLLTLEKESKKQRKRTIEKERQNRLITEEWIKNSISPNLIQMLWRFNEILKRLEYISNIRTKKELEKRKKLRPYLLDKRSISKLLEAYANIYNRLFFELEKLRLKLPVYTISYKQFEKNTAGRVKKQNECKHTFSKPKILATSLDGRSEKIVEQCSICGYKKGYEKRRY